MKPTKLKPCPFCGNKDGLEDGAGWDGYVVRCPNCGVYGPWADTIAGAREEWNKRLGPAP